MAAVFCQAERHRHRQCRRPPTGAGALGTDRLGSIDGQYQRRSPDLTEPSHTAPARHGRQARLAAFPLDGLLLVAGCANQPGNETRTLLEGAGIGGVIGGGIVYAIDGPRGAAVGAAIVGSAGVAVAAVVNAERRSYANNAQRLDAEQRIAGRNLTAMSAYNQNLAHRVANLDAQAERYARERAAGRADLAAASRLRGTMESEATSARENLERLETALGESRRHPATAYAEAGSRSAEVATLERSIRELEGERVALRSSIDRISASMRRV
jgi:hypothetical protein